MTQESTLIMIKPDAIRRGVAGKVISYIEQAGFEIVAQKMMQLSTALAEEFYAEHKERPFFGALVANITAGPVIPMVCRGAGVVSKMRELIGATDPKAAAAGTIRGDLGESIDTNTIHGSDSLASAAREISFFFSNLEILK